MPETLTLRLLGGFEASFGDGAPLSFKNRKTQGLLAVLALSAGAAVPRDRLTALLWGDRADEQARGSLRQALSDLRRVLGAAADELVQADRDSITLQTTGLDCDVLKLQDQGSYDVTALYRGEFLEGFSLPQGGFEDWLAEERTRIAGQAQAGLLKELESQRKTGETEPAIATARTLLSIDPLQEVVHRALMALYAEHGDRALALRQYQACRDLLQAELGIEPEVETQALFDRLREGDQSAAVQEETPAEPAAVASSLPDKPSIVVLPFMNMSGDAEQEYFADGITEDIITQLSRFRSIFVIASNSSFHYKGRSPKVQDVGRELGVEYVVEGSVRKAGNRVRITAQLVEAASGAHLWAERYDRDLDDIFAVQDEVAAEIVTAVPGQVDIANRAQADRKPATDLTAYDLLLRAEAIFYQDWTSLEALRLFEQAVETDPSFARAHSRLANHLGYLVFAHGYPTEETWRRVRAHVEKALELDPNDAVVQASAAEAFILLGEHDLAKRHIDKAISLNPNDANVIIYAGINHAYLGQYEEGVKWVELALRRDPYAGDAIREAFFDCYMLAGEYEKAINQMTGWRNPPPHMWVTAAAAYALMGDVDKANEMAAKFKALSPENWDRPHIRQAHLQMCAKQEDRDRLYEGYKKAGVPI